MFKFDVFHMDKAGACYYSVAESPDKAPDPAHLARLLWPGHDVLTITRHKSERAFKETFARMVAEGVPLAAAADCTIHRAGRRTGKGAAA